jgi:uncharacterized protein
MADGGIPFPQFTEDVQQHSYGSGSIENITAMIDRHPTYDKYWADKAAVLEDITIPAYVVASTTNALHSKGTLNAFRRLGSPEKWLRVHNTMEWPDYYEPANVADLRRFFDHYLKGASNGWTDTPSVRLSIIDLGGVDIVNRTETHWPPTSFTHQTLHLDAQGGTLSATRASQASTSYVSDDGEGSVSFDHVFTKDTEVAANSTGSVIGPVRSLPAMT